jgi:hypothetical protein
MGQPGNSSDNRDEPHATSAGCRRSLERIQDRPSVSCAGTRYAAWPDIPAGGKRLGRDGAWRVGRLAGNTGSSVAGKSLPPRHVWAPTLRKADSSARRRRYRVWFRVPTASSPMGSHANAAGAGQHRLNWRHFSPALTIPGIARELRHRASRPHPLRRDP